LTLLNDYAIIKEKEKEKDMKKNLEIVVAELEKALEWNSGVVFGLYQALENDDKNDRKNYELNQCEKTHTKLFNALVIAKKLLKEINQELKKGE
jgi:hypothetical protein